MEHGMLGNNGKNVLQVLMKKNFGLKFYTN